MVYLDNEDFARFDPTVISLIDEIVEMSRILYPRGWFRATSGNISSVVNTEPLTLAITASGFDKGQIDRSKVVLIDQMSSVILGKFKPSYEAKLHIAVVRERSAGAVIHTHSVYGTIISMECLSTGGLEIEGLEMLKALDGVPTHEHREWLPVLRNSQDMDLLSNEVTDLLRADKKTHGFLLSGHGLYTWGRNLDEAKRHAEALEFLMEVSVRMRNNKISADNISLNGGEE